MSLFDKLIICQDRELTILNLFDSIVLRQFDNSTSCYNIELWYLLIDLFYYRTFPLNSSPCFDSNCWIVVIWFCKVEISCFYNQETKKLILIYKTYCIFNTFSFSNVSFSVAIEAFSCLKISYISFVDYN